MKARLNTTDGMRSGTGLLLAIAGIAVFQTQALAGGLAWLRLPIDGTTREDEETIADIVRERLKPYVNQTAVDLQMVTVRDGYVRMPLAARPVVLSDLQASLKGSGFSIPREQLHFDGVVRLEIDAVGDLENLLADLRAAPKISVSAKVLDHGRISILIESPRRELTPLLSYRDLNRILSVHGAKLQEVNWGADSKAFGNEDFAHWYCGAPFGALRVADVEPDAPRQSSVAKVTTGKPGAAFKKGKSTPAKKTGSDKAGF